ncbi:MAG: hypothetical protein NZM31_13150 [Gemmatales bacterium]|nr:hypothetical protein [Gemmatales bacterium]MDW8387944.1 hypothetical protein [Gemmatales bacterium]
MNPGRRGSESVAGAEKRSRSLALPVLYGLMLLVLFLVGCTRAPEGPKNNAAFQTPQELLTAALATLRVENPTLTTYRSAIQQFNSYLDQRPDIRDKIVLSDDDKNVIRGELGVDLRDRRGAELESKSFTPLDAFHIDARLLFRDAVRSWQLLLGPEPVRPAERDQYRKELATLLFDWMTRQVQLQPRIRGIDDPRAVEIVRRFRQFGPDQLALMGIRDVNDALGRNFWPAHEVLRRGTGDAEECARILLGLFEQARIPAGIVTRTIEVQDGDKTEKREILWVVGAVIGNDIYLFDPLMRKPIAGPGGQGIATLRQARSDPAILEAHYAAVRNDPEKRRYLTQCQYDSSHPLITTAEMIQQSSLLLMADLSALAPRMKQLEGWLADDGNNAVLFDDIEERLKILRGMNLGVHVAPWRTRGGYPTTVLVQFVEDPLSDVRRTALLSPRSFYFPEWVHKMAEDMQSPERTHEIFSRFDNFILRIRLEPGSPRDLLVRGRPELAVEKIVASQYELDKTMEVLRDTMDPARISASMRDRLGPEAVRLVTRLNDLKVQEQKAPANSELQRQLREEIRLEEKRFDALWKENRVNLAFLTFEWAEPLAREHLTYFMALAKLELAVRADLLAERRGQAGPERVRDALVPAQRWRSAEEWFERYLALVLPQPRSEWAAAAEQFRAYCRQAQTRPTADAAP